MPQNLLRYILFALLLSTAASSVSAAPTNALKNPQFAAVADGVPANWNAFEGGFDFAAGAGYKGSDAVTMTRAQGDKARGSSQVVTLNQKVAAPVTLSGWSKSQGVSGEPDNGYAIFADVTYADGSNGWGFFAPFKTGTTDWNRAEVQLNADKPIQSLTFYALFREHTGKVWFSDLAIELDGKTVEVPVKMGSFNRLNNGDFAATGEGTAVGWTGFEGGYQLAPKQGTKGSDAITATRGDGDKGRGAAQVVMLNQTKAEPITLSGWSRAQNVSGDADNDYALYADLVYADGSNGWGFNAPFVTGTSDWNFATTEITPEKPVKSLTFYAMFRNHTGQVWFSDLAVETAAPALAQLPSNMKLVDVEPQIKIPLNLYKATIDGKNAAMRVVGTRTENLLRNADWKSPTDGVPQNWQKWEDGFTLDANGGREGRAAAVITNAQGDPQRGIFQQLELNQSEAQSLVLSGWSRAQDVSGTPDVDYSLYADLVLQDGREVWGQSVPFLTGTHDWQRASTVIAPGQPIKSIKVYALFRGHTGKVWFSDLVLGAQRAPAGGALFDGLGVKTVAAPLVRNVALKKTVDYATKDGLSLSMNDAGAIASIKVNGREVKSNAPSGFLARDVANGSDIFALGDNSAALKLKLTSKITAFDDHLVVEGNVADLTGKDRAITLFWALPVEAANWQWGQTMRREKRVGNEEQSNTVPFFAGANGQASLYPLANIHDEQSGLAIALDPDLASQNRLAVNGATKQFTLAYDFGLTPEKPSADFRFVIYRTDPQWGFRDALAKMGRIFPGTFEARGEAKQQGLWMPFTDVSKVQGWQDFGFRFREAAANIATDPSLKWDDANGILTFRYFEPSAWWMPMDDATPRNYENAIRDLRRIASDPGAGGHEQAQAVLSSGYRAASGRYALIFRDEPWAKGAVWSLNPDPKIVGKATGASIGWDAADKQIYADKSNGTLDGEYLDSLEGYVTANLNFDREQFKVARAPLTFETTSNAPAQHKALLAFDYVRNQSREVHALGKLMFANSVPSRFTFLAAPLDVMGTETDWMTGGTYRPDDDDVMSLRRAMSGTKPYLLLQNTDYDKFTPPYVEKYMERSLFYGMFPDFFSANAAESPYWENPKWVDRDRPMFQKYIPLVKRVAEAGWQPLTLAKSDNSSVWLERYGAKYLTVLNSSSTAQKANVTLQAPVKFGAQSRDLVSGSPIGTRGADGSLALELAPEQVVVLELG